MAPTQQRIPESIRKPVKRLFWGCRYATSGWRTLPDMLIIGAQKAGTSSLHAWLSGHPQILPPFEKEVHFFDGGNKPGQNNYEKGLPWYKAHFPLTPSDRKITFETSPLYLFHPLAAQRIRTTLPEVKMIAVLRNPVDRAISHYFHSVKNGVETLSLEDALASEEARLGEASSSDAAEFSFVRHSYKARGRYAEQLERYLQCFPRDQLLVLDSERLFSDPETCLAEVFEFIGVDTNFCPESLSARNVAPNRQDVGDETYAALADYFSPYNQKLCELTGKEFNW